MSTRPLSTPTSVSLLTSASPTPDPEMLATTRRNIPVTVQRRFDVYPDVANAKN